MNQEHLKMQIETKKAEFL